MDNPRDELSPQARAFLDGALEADTVPEGARERIRAAVASRAMAPQPGFSSLFKLHHVLWLGAIVAFCGAALLIRSDAQTPASTFVVTAKPTHVPESAPAQTQTRAQVVYPPEEGTKADMSPRTTGKPSQKRPGLAMMPKPIVAEPIAVEAQDAADTLPLEHSKDASKDAGQTAAEDEPTEVDEPSRLGLAEELRMLKNAREHFSHGAGDAALAVLETYAQAFPLGSLRRESLILKVQSLCLNGDPVAARNTAATLRELPGGFWLPEAASDPCPRLKDKMPRKSDEVVTDFDASGHQEENPNKDTTQ